MKSCGKWLGLIAVVSLVPAEVRTAASDAVVTVTPEETDEILANPGMGWETFHRTSPSRRRSDAVFVVRKVAEWALRDRSGRTPSSTTRQRCDYPS